MKVNEIFGHLFEEAVDKKPTYKNLSTEEAIKFLNTHCKNALWMLEKNKPFYRGITEYKDVDITKIKGFSLVNTELTTRRSQNTSNYYTVILDNNPLNKDFPKRSKSFVGTTSFDYALGYSSSGHHGVFVMVPTDSAKIGVVNHSDMWHTKIKLFGLNKNIEEFNNYFAELFNYPLSETITIDMFKDFDSRLKSGDVTAISNFHSAFGFRKDVYHTKFLEEIFDAYSSKKTGHEWYYSSNFPTNILQTNTEVWISGKIVLISFKMWNSLVKAYKQQK